VRDVQFTAHNKPASTQLAESMDCDLSRDMNHTMQLDGSPLNFVKCDGSDYISNISPKNITKFSTACFVLFFFFTAQNNPGRCSRPIN